ARSVSQERWRSTFVLSLRRHDPDQVQRVFLSPKRAPLGTTFNLCARARVSMRRVRVGYRCMQSRSLRSREIEDQAPTLRPQRLDTRFFAGMKHIKGQACVCRRLTLRRHKDHAHEVAEQQHLPRQDCGVLQYTAED